MRLSSRILNDIDDSLFKLFLLYFIKILKGIYWPVDRETVNKTQRWSRNKKSNHFYKIRFIWQTRLNWTSFRWKIIDSLGFTFSKHLYLLLGYIRTLWLFSNKRFWWWLLQEMITKISDMSSSLRSTQFLLEFIFTPSQTSPLVSSGCYWSKALFYLTLLRLC